MLDKLQNKVKDNSKFVTLEDFFQAAKEFISFINETRPTRIVSPNYKNYIFYQYTKKFGFKITRPLNSNLFIDNTKIFNKELDVFMTLLKGLSKQQEKIANNPKYKKCIEGRNVNKIIYTIQQSLGSIGDSFSNANQSRKRVGQLFENLIKLIIKEVGLECEPRRISIPLPKFPIHKMSYELDVVFSRNKAIITSEYRMIHENEVVGSIKTTSKDRIDKIFLDKFLLERLLGYKVPVVAIFLHDVQRARKGNNNFGINSTFKTNHFLGYTLALNKLDGVYYVDPRPEFTTNIKLKEQIFDFTKFLVHDLWALSK